MSIVKNKMTSHFSQFPNALITDTTISAKAYRVMTYLLSLPDNWEINNADVCKKLDISLKMIAIYWKELIKSGWITRTKQERFNGKYSSFIYQLNEVAVITESDITESDFMECQITEPEITEPEITDAVNHSVRETIPLTNTHPSNNTHIINNTQSTNNNASFQLDKIRQKEIPFRKIIEIKGEIKETILGYEPIAEVIKYFNQKTNSKFRNHKQTINNIKKILIDYTVEDIKLVIDSIASNDWYITNHQVVLPVICRSTLFASKLDIAISQRDKHIKQPAKFNDVGEFSLETSGVYKGIDVLRKLREKNNEI